MSTPGFFGRRRAESADLPPGQYLTKDFPVLSAGPTPRVATDEWELAVDDRDRGAGARGAGRT